MEKILTIVIPTYNMQDYLRRCLDSLIVPEEQMKQLEVLVVNDGSKDNSSGIAHEYQDKYPDTFRVIDKENGNYGSCVNRGLKEATGKYIKILDADDWFDSFNFQAFIALLFQTNADVVVTDFKKYFDDKTEKVSFEFGLKNSVYSLENALNENRKQVMLLPMHAICYKSSCFNNIDYHQTEGISYTDQEWILIPWSNVHSLIYYPLSLYQYNLAREGQTCDLKVFHKKMPEQFLSIRNTIKKYYDLFPVLDEFHRELLYFKIIERMENLYRNILMFERISPSYLINFDKELVRESSKFSNKLAEITLHPYFKCHYIRRWRKKGYIPLSKSLILLNKIMEKLANVYKGIITKVIAKKQMRGG